MIKLQFTFILIMAFIKISFGQVTKDTINSYKYYDSLFITKGTYSVNDGMHKIIFTVRFKEDSSVTKKLREGMIRIENNKFIAPLLIKNTKGVYVKTDKKGDPLAYKKYKVSMDANLRNGRSHTYVAEDGSLVDIFVIDVLKP